MPAFFTVGASSRSRDFEAGTMTEQTPAIEAPMTDEPQSIVEAIIETPFVQDQESLSTPRGIALNIVMVAIAAAMCGLLIYVLVR
jgi:hypothetical protein